MQSVEIIPGVHWVGVQDPDLRLFDIVMHTRNGSSYNAYLIQGQEKTALIDTVKVDFFEEFLDKLERLVDLQKIDYLIVQHTEPDHAGSIRMLLDRIPGLTVVTNYTAYTFLREIVNRDFPVKFVAHDDELDLGERTLRFIGAPLLHWPETFYSFLVQDRILFSSDTFGSHFADERLFNDQIDRDFLPDFRYYYDMILSPFKKYLWAALKRVEDLDIQIICPGHGPILRERAGDYIKLYRDWTYRPSRKGEKPKVVLAYVSAYGYTGKMAQAIEKGLSDEGDFDLHCFDLTQTPMDQVLSVLEGASGFLIGSPTINKDAAPPAWDLLTKLSPVNTSGIVAAAFGAYGWSGEAVPNMESRLRMLRMRLMPGLRFQFQPSDAQLEQAREFGRSFARALQGDDRLLEAPLEFQLQENPNNPRRFDPASYRKSYRNKDLLVYWNPDQCSHDTNCFSTLSKVFAPEKRPWVNLEGEPAEKIIRTIDACPSGALKYEVPDGSSVPPELAKGPGWIHYKQQE